MYFERKIKSAIRNKFWTFFLTCYTWYRVNTNWRMKTFFWYCLYTAVSKFSNSSSDTVSCRLLSSSCFQQHFHDCSMYIGTIQICQNLNGHYYCLLSTKLDAIRQLDANFSFHLLNMLSVHIRLEHSKLTCFLTIAEHVIWMIIRKITLSFQRISDIKDQQFWHTSMHIFVIIINLIY